MQFKHSAVFAALALGATVALAQNVSGGVSPQPAQSNVKPINVGPSESSHGGTGQVGAPGVGLLNISDGKRIPVSTIHGGYVPPGPDGYSRIAGGDHGNPPGGMGSWTVGKVGNSTGTGTPAAGTDVYYGVWSGRVGAEGEGAPVRHVAWFVGSDPTTSLAAVAGQTKDYTLGGVRISDSQNPLTGSLTAAFNAAGNGGTVTAGGVGGHDFSNAAINAAAQFNKSGAGVDVHGQFYGAQANAVAGYVNVQANQANNIAFGGSAK